MVSVSPGPPNTCCLTNQHVSQWTVKLEHCIDCDVQHADLRDHEEGNDLLVVPQPQPVVKNILQPVFTPHIIFQSRYDWQ